QGWSLVERATLLDARAQREEGLRQLREGLAAVQAIEAELWISLLLGAVSEGYRHGGQTQEGLQVIAEALAMVEKNDERWNEAELYRLKGELMLQQFQVSGSTFHVPSLQHLTPSTQAEAEACFLKAIEIARKQQAKSLELRAALSLSRLW